MARKGLIDKSLSFGMQNWFSVEIDESDGTYNYYGFVNKKNSILIMRTNKTTTEIRYRIDTGVFATIWSAKGTGDYYLPNELVDQNV